MEQKIQEYYNQYKVFIKNINLPNIAPVLSRNKKVAKKSTLLYKFTYMYYTISSASTFTKIQSDPLLLFSEIACRYNFTIRIFSSITFYPLYSLFYLKRKDLLQAFSDKFASPIFLYSVK